MVIDSRYVCMCDNCNNCAAPLLGWDFMVKWMIMFYDRMRLMKWKDVGVNLLNLEAGQR